MKKNLSSIIFLGIIAVTTSLLAWGALSDSATMDELAHIPAAYSYTQVFDYRLNPEHPPFIKIISGIPLNFLSLSFPYKSSAWQENANAQWSIGTTFLYEIGNNADLIIRLARIGPILITILTILFLYNWAREREGEGWSLIPTSLFALSPIILAHGHYVTTDIAAAFGILISLYFFLKYLRDPSQTNMLEAGIALGIAELTKFSALLLLPFFILLTLIHALIQKNTESRFYIWQNIKSTFLIIFAAYAFVVYPIYAIFTLGMPPEKQTRDTVSLLSTFAGGPPKTGEVCSPKRCLAEITIAVAKNPLSRPLAHYALGALMVVDRESFGNTNYFLGSVSNSGSPEYFPILYLFKEPIPVLIFTILGILGLLFSLIVKSAFFKNKRKFFTENFDTLSILLFIAIYWLISIKSNLNIGIRHIIPVLPLMYLLATTFWREWLVRAADLAKKNSASFFHASSATLQWMVAILLVFWIVTEIGFAFPNFISYYNQFGGGKWNGYRVAVDSNYDWGQDLLRLRKWINSQNNDADAQNDIDQIAVDYFGGGDVNYYLGDKAIKWTSREGNPSEIGIQWFAVSINNLQNAIQPALDGYKRDPETEYGWLREFRASSPGIGKIPEPDARAGTSIFIYKL